MFGQTSSFHIISLLFDKAKYKKISKYIYKTIVFFAASETKRLACKMSVSEKIKSNSFNQLSKYLLFCVSSIVRFQDDKNKYSMMKNSF